MGTTLLFSQALGRPTLALISWFFVAVIMLIGKPDLLGDVSFQLSTLATLGILLCGNPKKIIHAPPADGMPLSKNRNMRNYLWQFFQDDLRVTLAAQVFTFPIMVLQFHRISLIAPLSNVLIGWLIPPVTILGMCMVGIGIVVYPLGFIFAPVVWFILSYILFVIDLTSQIPYASITW